MKKNSIIKKDNCYYRVLAIKDNEILAIDCIKKTMPKWYTISGFNPYQEVLETELLKYLNVKLIDIEELPLESKRIAYERYTLIAAILPFVADQQQQNKVIS